jgi:hypothetical protein
MKLYYCIHLEATTLLQKPIIQERMVYKIVYSQNAQNFNKIITKDTNT